MLLVKLDLRSLVCYFKFSLLIWFIIFRAIDTKNRMDSRDSNVQQNSPIMCKNGCGFYANAGSEGLCSVCYKELAKKQQAPPTTMPASFSKWLLVTLPLVQKAISDHCEKSFLSRKIVNVKLRRSQPSKKSLNFN